MKRENRRPKNALALMLAALALFAPNARAGQTATIQGQIFIRTQGGDSIKLSLVTVALFDLKTLSDILQKKNEAAVPVERYFAPLKTKAEEGYEKARAYSKEASDATSSAIGNGGFDAAEAASTAADKAEQDAAQAFNELSGREDYPRSALYYFADLPDPLQITKTDADGKFTFKVPAGSYALIATTTRNAGVEVIGDSSFPKTESYYWMVKVTADTDKTVMLANDNLSSSGSPDSLVQTLSDQDEQRVVNTMGIDGIQTLLTFVHKKEEEQHQAELQIYRDDPQAAQRKAVQLYP